MRKIKIFDGYEKINGFNFQPGFAVLVEGKNILAATSGWECNGMLFVYRPTEDGWRGDWEGQETFPVQEVQEAIQDWQDSAELSKALQYAEGKKLYLSNEDIVFTDVVPGEKHRDGGEYGFYTRYSPIPEYPGIYRVYSETTCDFDACGTGYEGITALTIAEYRKLRKKSDEIEAAGSLY
jgi:hypothetical protein